MNTETRNALQAQYAAIAAAEQTIKDIAFDLFAAGEMAPRLGNVVTALGTARNELNRAIAPEVTDAELAAYSE